MKDITFVTITCAKDVHYAKCLLGSIRHFYQENPIIVIADDDITERHIEQIKKFGAITIYRSSELRKIHNLPLTGLLTKLNLLFIPNLEKCVVMDADSVLVGPILDLINEDDEIVAFDGKLLDLKNSALNSVFNKFAISLEDLKLIDPAFKPDKVIYMNSGHFFLDKKKFPLEELIKNVPYLNKDFAHVGPFRFGDQGFINYVVNKYNGKGLNIRYMDMSIPGKFSEVDSPYLNISTIKSKTKIEKYIIHYTAPSRKHRIADHNFGEILNFFENKFYSTLSFNSYLFDRVERRIKFLNKRVSSRISRKFNLQRQLSEFI